MILLLLMFTAAVVADRWRQVSEATQFVHDSLLSARAALEADDVKQALLRLAEAQTRIDANRLNNHDLIHDVTELGRESERYAQLNLFYQRARDAFTTDSPTDEVLALYRVMDAPDWLGSLHAANLPEAVVHRVMEKVYELLLLKADFLSRWDKSHAHQAVAHEAMKYLDQAASFHAPSRGYYWLLANCCLLTGDQEREKSLRETALKTKPHDASELFYINRDHVWGTVSSYRGYPKYSFEESFKDHREMLRLDPTYRPGLFFMAYRLDDEGRHAESLVAWYGATALHPNDPYLLANRAGQHLCLGQYDEAIEDCRESIRLKPDNDVAHFSLGLALVRCGQTGEAIDEFRETIRLNPNNWDAYVQLADAFELKGVPEEAITRYREAAAVFRKHLKLNPDDGEVQCHLVWVLAMCPDCDLRDPHEALELAKAAAKRGQRDENTWNSLGIAHYRMGDWQDSIDAVCKEMKLPQGDDEGFQRFLLAMAEWQLGSHQAARDWYAKGAEWMETNPSDGATIRFRREAKKLIQPVDTGVREEYVEARTDRIAVAPSQFAGSAARGSLNSIGRNPPPYGVANGSADQGWMWKVGDYFTVDLATPTALQRFRVWSVYAGDLTGRGARWEILSSDDGVSFTHEADFTYIVGRGMHGLNDDRTARPDSTGWFEADFNAAAGRHRFWQVKDVATLFVHSPRSAQVELYGSPNDAKTR